MAILNQRLVAATLTGALTTYYTVAALKRVTVTSITLADTNTATNRSCTVKLAGKFLVPATSVSAKEVFGISIGHVLEATETIQAMQDGSGDVDLIVSGVVEDV